jgi:hypothetical protein
VSLQRRWLETDSETLWTGRYISSRQPIGQKEPAKCGRLFKFLFECTQKKIFKANWVL